MPNNDLISRKALIEHLSTILMSDVFHNWANTEMKVKCSVGILGERFRREIEAAPAADAEPVRHGKWIENYAYGAWHYDCPFCDDGYATKKREKKPVNYCPNCGAKMDKEE